MLTGSEQNQRLAKTRELSYYSWIKQRALFHPTISWSGESLKLISLAISIISNHWTIRCSSKILLKVHLSCWPSHNSLIVWVHQISSCMPSIARIREKRMQISRHTEPSLMRRLYVSFSFSYSVILIWVLNLWNMHHSVHALHRC
jgi:hypothetical protein